MQRDRHLTGAVLFVAALNFKQMALYYAVPVFVYLLGKTLRAPRPFLALVVLGSVVLGTFAALMAPIATTPADVLQGVLSCYFDGVLMNL